MQKNCLGYPVEIVDGLFGESPVLAETLRKVTGVEKPRVALVADLNVVQRTDGLGASIGHYLQNAGITLAARPTVIGGGERAKIERPQYFERIVGDLVAANLEKTDCVLALGGGVLADLVGYVAAQLSGGIGIVRLPTTPAAMIDAAFSEVAAIDFGLVKNALKVASRPAAVLIDPKFAMTVLDGVWRGGFGEAVRLAAANDATFFKLLVKLAPAYAAHDLGAMREIVESAVALRKKKKVASFGLWAAERLEEMSSYKLPHGYAVSLGICIDSQYAVEKGYLKATDAEKVTGLLAQVGIMDGIRPSRPLLKRVDQMLAGLDRWRRHTGSESIVLPAGIGKSVVDEVPDRETFSRVFASCS